MATLGWDPPPRGTFTPPISTDRSCVQEPSSFFLKALQSTFGAPRCIGSRRYGDSRFRRRA